MACGENSGGVAKTTCFKLTRFVVVKNIAGELKTSSRAWLWSSKLRTFGLTPVLYMGTGSSVAKLFFICRCFETYFWTFRDVVEFRYSMVLVKQYSIVFCLLLDVVSLWHLRTMPQTMPAWLIVLANTLGARQGTLYKAPRNAEVKLQDDNVFCKNDYWNLNACKASTPLPLSHQIYIMILISVFLGGEVQTIFAAF